MSTPPLFFDHPDGFDACWDLEDSPWKVIILIRDEGFERSHILGRLFYIFCLGRNHLESLNFPFLETLLRELRERLMLYFEEYLAKLGQTSLLKVEEPSCRKHVIPRSLCSGDILFEC